MYFLSQMVKILMKDRKILQQQKCILKKAILWMKFEKNRPRACKPLL